MEISFIVRLLFAANDDNLSDEQNDRKKIFYSCAQDKKEWGFENMKWLSVY